ncbi:hypothetical protein QUF63_15950 [Anaerolineales bacterium HSG25]|nr:hypothetical protein [Anaerolineales bacterium HSG25]
MANDITRQVLYFVGPKQVELRTETIAPPKADQILIRTELSAISHGTERLIYEGQVPTDMPLDETLPDLAGTFQYPFKYGYALVGRVEQVGSAVSSRWLNRLVFAFHPHENHFVTTPEQVLPIPEEVSAEDALFLPNMETAVNLVLDGQPLMGERVAVFGQGVVGLLTTALLSDFPLAELTAVEPTAHRSTLALDWADAYEAAEPEEIENSRTKYDLVYELSGQPSALNLAVNCARFGGRIVVGSWYGNKPVTLDLGSRFHRQRLQIMSSQVSTLSPHLSGRWSKERRLNWAWLMVEEHEPSDLISHRFSIEEAVKAYKALRKFKATAVQIVLTY